jgi:hypothetical protein
MSNVIAHYVWGGAIGSGIVSIVFGVLLATAYYIGKKKRLFGNSDQHTGTGIRVMWIMCTDDALVVIAASTPPTPVITRTPSNQHLLTRTSSGTFLNCSFVTKELTYSFRIKQQSFSLANGTALEASNKYKRMDFQSNCHLGNNVLSCCH